MKRRDYRDYLQDIVQAIEDIETFVAGMSYADFVNDKKTVNAVVRSIEVIGEATKKLPVSLKKKYALIPWKKMAGMRDKLIHEYFGIDLEILWAVAERDISLIKPAIKKIAIKAGILK